MKIATLNINSVNARLPNLLDWLTTNQPDIMFLQEIKCEFNNFPLFDVQMSGYDAKILGQKSYNGVAVLSKYKMVVRAENLPDFADENARYLEVEVEKNGEKYVAASLYLPNGNPPYNNLQDTSRFDYKLRWTEAFLKRAESLLIENKNVIFGGDFNIIMTPQDVYNPELFVGNALYRPEVQNQLRRLMNMGYTDCYRALFPNETGYTFWDYTGGALINDLGMRIDYIFASPYLADRLHNCKIDRDFRAKEKASDHTILMVDFA